MPSDKAVPTHNDGESEMDLDDSNDDVTGTFDRRSCLKLGAALVTAVTAGATGAAAEKGNGNANGHDDDGDSTSGDGEFDRPLFSENDQTVSVDPNGGAEYRSLQTAIEDNLAVFQRHRIRFDLAPGDYDEHIVVPNTITQILNPNPDESWGGERNPVYFEGEPDDPSAVAVKSIFVDGAYGSRVAIEGLTITSHTPYDNESSGIRINSGGDVVIANVEYANYVASRRGLTAYNGDVTVFDTDFGDGLCEDCILAKHQGRVLLNGGVDGRGHERGVFADGGAIVISAGDTLTGDTKDYDPVKGFYLDTTTNETQGMNRFSDGTCYPQCSNSTVEDMQEGERLVYTSDGSDAHEAGDLVAARNDGGTIVSQVIAAAADDE